MDSAEIRTQFNAAAAGYGGWHQRYAERLIELTPLMAGQRVLDVGTGTGLAAIAASRVVGPRGFVQGIDVAEQMVSEAKLAAAAAGLTNTAFDVADAMRLPFERASFDVVICSSAIIYLPLPDALHEWSRVLRPVGIAAFSTLQQDAPRAGVVFREVAASLGVRLENPNAIGSLASCRALMEGAGYDIITITSEAIPADSSTPEEAWDANVASAAFSGVRVLKAGDLELMRAAYLATLTVSDLAAPYDALFVVARQAQNPRASSDIGPH